MSYRIIPRPDNEKPCQALLDEMRERGSVCGLRYAFAHRIESIIDVTFEQVSPAIYLATANTSEGVEWLRRSFRSRTEHVWFGDAYVLRRDEYRRLVQTAPDDICHETAPLY